MPLKRIIWTFGDRNSRNAFGTLLKIFEMAQVPLRPITDSEIIATNNNNITVENSKWFPMLCCGSRTFLPL